MDLLDNLNVLAEKDPQNSLGVIASAPAQTRWEAKLENAQNADFTPAKIILAGMGGSCLGGLMAKSWLDFQYKISETFDISRDYVLPNFVDEKTLVICFSVSGNTEETLAALADAEAKHAKIAVISSGGKLLEIARAKNLPFVELDKISQPRYGVIMHLRAITKILAHFKIAEKSYDEIANLFDEISRFTSEILPEIPRENNFAKNLASHCAGKTPIIYASNLFAPLAYKWKISFNENAKNCAWWNEFPEFCHNEFIGWTSHPVEKKFAILDLRSNFDHPRVSLRFDLTEKLLSGKRPAAREISLAGESVLAQMCCGAILADFTSIYLGILNGVNPTPVALVEELKKALA